MNETFPYALIALLGVLLGAGGLIAASISRAVFQGVRRAWPLVLLAVVYAVAFMSQPPVPLQAVISLSGLTLWDALRYGALGTGFAMVALDYFKVQCKLDNLQGRGEA